MNLFQKFFSIGQKALPQQQDITSNNDLLKALYRYLGMASPVWIDDSQESYVNNAYRSNADVYSIVKLITRSASQIPFCVYEVKDTKALQRYKSLTQSTTQESLAPTLISRAKALEEIEHPYLSKLLTQPNPNQGWSEFVENILGFKLVTGNGYAYGNGPTTKDIFTELWVMPSQYTLIHSGGWMDEISHYTLSFAPQVKIDPSKVLHTKYFNLDYSQSGSHLYGMSPIRAASKVVTLSNEAYTANSTFFKNMIPPGILVSDDTDLPLTQQQAEQLKRRLIKSHSGSKRAGDIPISAASLKFINLGLSPVDLNIIESQKMSLRDLCNVYGVNSALLNDPENKSYNNMKEARKALITNVVLPELYQLRDELNRWLVPKFEKQDGKRYYIDIDTTGIVELMPDRDKLSQQLDRAWYLTGNEKRMALGYDTDQDSPLMNDYLVAMNKVPLSQMGISTEDNVNKSIDYLSERNITDYPSQTDSPD